MSSSISTFKNFMIDMCVPLFLCKIIARFKLEGNGPKDQRATVVEKN